MWETTLRTQLSIRSEEFKCSTFAGAHTTTWWAGMRGATAVYANLSSVPDGGGRGGLGAHHW